MTEENSMENFHPTTKERKEKLPSKKRWMEMARQYQEINPQTQPGETMRRIRDIQDFKNPNKNTEEREKAVIVNNLRKKRLEQLGLNPDEWAYFYSTQPEGFGSQNMQAPLTEQDMAKISARLPEGIELFVIQGGISSGSEFVKEENPYQIMNHWWEIYVREKPYSILEAPNPELPEGSNS